jgi:ribosomal protein S18 acetylase RimI-like enzyme
MQIRLATVEDSAGLGRVQLASWRFMWRTLAPDDYLERFSDDERAEAWQDLLTRDPEQIVHLAQDENGDVIGYCCALPDRNEMGAYKAEISSFHIVPAYHRQGIGRELMQATARYLRQRGFPSLYLSVIKQNPSRGFYERMGGQLLDREFSYQIGNLTEFTVTEVTYGWLDIGGLCGDP